MPKLNKLFRNRKQSSTSEAPTKTKKSGSGIFRLRSRGAEFATKQNVKEQGPVAIAPAITFTLSEDETTGFSRSPVGSDIENNHTQELLRGDTEIQHVKILPAPAMATAQSGEIGSEETSIEDKPISADAEARHETKDVSSVGTENNKTMTFTHLQIMRNELAHMMQLAEKDQEIHALKQSNEELKASYAKEIQAKENEILKIKKALQATEAALAVAENKLLVVNKEQSETIQVLMKTQYDYHELKNNQFTSWIAPVLNYFDSN